MRGELDVDNCAAAVHELRPHGPFELAVPAETAAAAAGRGRAGVSSRAFGHEFCR